MRVVVCIVAAAVLVLHATGCADRKSRFDAHLIQAESAFNAGEFEKARVEFKNALQIFPEDAHASYRLGRTQQELQRWQGAATAFLHAIRVDPTHLPSRLALARLYLGSEHPEQAAEHIEAALNQEPTSADALALRASLHVLAKDLKNAIVDAQGALNRAPERVDITMLLVSTLAQDGQLEEAYRILGKALQAYPTHQPLWELKAKVEYHQGDRKAAADSLSALLELSPLRSDIRNVLANLYTELGTPSDAEALLEENLEISSDPTKAKLSLIRHIVKTQSADAGVERLRTFLSEPSASSPLKFALAELFSAQGNLTEAEEVYASLIAEHALDPQGLRARQLLALLYTQQRKLESAKALADEVLAENPLDREALLLRGGLALVDNAPGTAIIHLRTVLRDHPNDLTSRKFLARAHVLNNEWDQARDELQRAIDSNPEDLDGHLLLVQLIDQVDERAFSTLRERTLQAARSILDARISENAEDIGSLVSRGRVALLARDPDAAREDLRQAVALAPKNAEALRLLAHAQANEKAEEQQQHLEQALAADPSHIPSRIDYVRHLAANGNMASALEETNTGLEHAVDNLDLLRLKARLEQNLSRWDALLTTAKKIQSVSPSDPLGFYLEGITYQATGKYADSALAFQSALERSPNAVEPLTALARTYFALRQYSTALEILNRVLVDGPRNLAALNLRGEVLLAQERFDDAEKSFEAALAVRPDWTVPYRNLGLARLAQGDAAGAVDAFVQLTTSQPDDLLAAYQLAITYERLGKPELAINQYEAILRRDQRQTVAANNLSMLLVEKAGASPEDLARALQLTANFEKSAQPHFRDTRAWVLLAAAQARQAEPILRQLVNQFPSVPIYSYHLGVALARNGDQQGARTQLENALRSREAFGERAAATAFLESLDGSR